MTAFRRWRKSYSLPREVAINGLPILPARKRRSVRIVDAWPENRHKRITKVLIVNDLAGN